jgi:hypothetical protein
MEIRTKKKAMQDDRSVIDSGGSPSMDLTDEDIMKRDAMTKEIGLDHNDPMTNAHEEDPMAKAENDQETRNEPHETQEPDSELMPNEMADGGEAETPMMDEAKAKRMARLRMKM